MCPTDGLKCKDCPDYPRLLLRREKQRAWRMKLLQLMKGGELCDVFFFKALQWTEDPDVLDLLPNAPPADLSAEFVQRVIALEMKWRAEDEVV